MKGNALNVCNALVHIQTTSKHTLKQTELIQLREMPKFNDITGNSVSSNKEQSQPHKQGLYAWGHPNITGETLQYWKLRSGAEYKQFQ